MAIDNGLRAYSRSELAADRMVHGLGLAAGLAGTTFLITSVAGSKDGVTLAAVIVYAAGLLAMLGSSAAYNLSDGKSESGLLRRLDHAAIFLMIAGTYTPFTVLGLEGKWSLVMTLVVWGLAGLGIAIKLFAPLGRSTFYSTVLYLALGWSGLVAIHPLVEVLSAPVLALLGAGGALYSIGVIFHALRRLTYQNAIWHGFVLAAAACHFAAVALLVAA